MIRRLLPLLLLCFFVWPARAQTPDAEFARAETAWDKRDYATAEAHFGRALEFAADDSDTAHALFGRGLARLQQEKWQGALDDLNDSIELNPDNAEAFASRGMARKSLGDFTGLLADAHRAAQLDPDNYAGFEDDAKSTVNWRRSMLGFIVLGCVLAAVGLVPMLKSLNHAIQGERQGKARAS